jgi:DNA-binding response OmpR family regulator
MGRFTSELRQSGLMLDRGVDILAVSLARADYAALRRIIGHSRWKLRRAWNFRRALAFLRRRPHGVVITDAGLPDGAWKYLLVGLAGLPVPPNLIVSSRLADEQLWAEVLNLGGYDVLLTPFQPEELFRVASAAWREWRARMDSAAALARPGLEPPAGMPVPLAHAAH